MKEFFKKNKILIGSLVFLIVYSITLVTFATPPTSPYIAGATLDPSCVPGSSNCTVSTLSIGQTIGNSSTDGSVLFVGTSGTIAQDNSNFFWDDTNNRLGLGITSPSYLLDIDGSPSPTISSISFTGTGGVDDLVASGSYTGAVGSTFILTITASETFSWYKNGILGSAGVAITGGAQLLSDGISVTFTGGATGHTTGSVWKFKAYANYNGKINTTAGIFQNGSQVIFQDTDINNLIIGANAGGSVISNVGSTFGAVILTSSLNTFVGINSANDVTSGYRNTFVGYNSGDGIITGGGNTFIGYGTSASVSTVTGSIALGYNAIATANNQFVVGTSNDTTGIITQMYLGGGVTSTIVSNTTINATGGSGTNSSGYGLGIAGGKSTGSGNGGDIFFQTAPAGSSGSTLNSLVQRMRITSAGLVSIGSTDQFSVNSLGNITRINNVITSWPSSQGGSNQFLKNDGSGNFSWDTPTITYGIGSTITSGSSGSILFVDSSGNLAQNNSVFFWDNSTYRLGIGTASPSAHLDIELAQNIVYSDDFYGSGLDDGTFSESYTGSTFPESIYVTIDSTGVQDTFSWSNDSGDCGGGETGVSITGDQQYLCDDISITFLAITGHTLSDQWVLTIIVSGSGDPVITVGDSNNRYFVVNAGPANSNLIGYGAGDNASNATESNFLGTDAGSGATSAWYSNFLGKNSGKNASTASYSNFIGIDAGSGATSADSSNFIGHGAGQDATGAESSNFIGGGAGNGATSATNSNFFGSSTGSGATSASASNFIGASAGALATNAASSNFIGNTAGFVATNATYSNFIGYGAGDHATSASYSTLIGYQSGKTFTANSLGSNNIIIGTNISLPNATANAINLGGILFATGTYSTTTGNPLITPVSGGKIGIGDTTPDYLLDVENTGTDGDIFAIHDSDGECLHNPEAGSETVTCSSDERLKTNIADASPMLPYLDAFHIRQYDVLASNDHLTGVIAQEVQALYPDLVTISENGYLSVASPNIWQIIKAIQELDVKISPLISLDLNITGSFGNLIKQYLENITNGLTKIFTGEVHTELLCVGQTCVTELQLQTLLNQQNNNGGTTSTTSGDDTTSSSTSGDGTSDDGYDTVITGDDTGGSTGETSGTGDDDTGSTGDGGSTGDTLGEDAGTT